MITELATISQPIALPLPQTPVTVRVATLADVPFIDSVQKPHTKQVGWMPMQQLEGKIGKGHVLVAETRQGLGSGFGSGLGADPNLHRDLHPNLVHSALPASSLGYVIGHDQYFKRDDVGIIYQIGVVESARRGLVGAALVQSVFERAAWGCKLFCCWCAQDLEANQFWESLGFVPLAFRTGVRSRGRTHIFWQRRIRAGDVSTPWWFPSQTSGGTIREDRIVLPIPPGTHWSDEMPRVLPSDGHEETKALRHEGQKSRRPSVPSSLRASVPSSASITSGGLRFVVLPEAKAEKAKPKAVKNDPKLVAAARELRDRWLEQMNSGELLPAARGKYDLSLPPSAPKGKAASLLIDEARLAA